MLTCKFYVVWISIRRNWPPLNYTWILSIAVLTLILLCYLFPTVITTYIFGIKIWFLICTSKKFWSSSLPKLCWNQWKYQRVNLAWVIQRRNINNQETRRKHIFIIDFFQSIWQMNTQSLLESVFQNTRFIYIMDESRMEMNWQWIVLQYSFTIVL